MTDTDLLKNTRNTRNTTGMGWAFSLCAADEGDSDSELEDASTGSHNSLVSSSDPPVSNELRLVRDLDLGARQDTAIFKSNPWTIAKLQAATRKPPSSTHCTGLSGLPTAPLQVLASTPTPKARSILDPQLKNSVLPQRTLRGKGPLGQQKQLSPLQTKRKLNPPSMGRNPYRRPGLPPICLDPPATYESDKIDEAIFAQPRNSPVENREGLGTRSKGPPFSSPGETTPHVWLNLPHLIVLVSVSPVALLGHIDPSLSPVKQSSHSTAHLVVSPNRFSFPDRLPNPLAFLPRSFISPIASPVKRRLPGALSVNRAGTKRKRQSSPLPSPLCPTRSVTPSPLLTIRHPVERIAPPKTPVHRQPVSAYDSRVFTSADEGWSTLPQNKSRTSASRTPTSLKQNSFRIPSLKLPGIGNQASKKSWLLTTFQPPPPLEVPNLICTSEPRANLEEDDARTVFLETMNNSSSQTVVENENFDG